ncbi:hypothetical protein CEUSTIGMA_g3861.t1 [Chlamydomonas eustigma]|uniref:Uncharacterized protein n=1 Tax=Chlamydomonas eustigma TaxID=1157962 RepID=A0A250X034_9CHLO|nr:hypothetical protein CEUSTIGMA_g3861.t1 [Chlamydomonas eustigma]|eukprot:GAX76416.1 hypothetical protein CEUSTIGMA_g3861.t1 [Chlamydomonas eustigma]
MSMSKPGLGKGLVYMSRQKYVDALQDFSGMYVDLSRLSSPDLEDYVEYVAKLVNITFLAGDTAIQRLEKRFRTIAHEFSEIPLHIQEVVRKYVEDQYPILRNYEDVVLFLKKFQDEALGDGYDIDLPMYFKLKVLLLAVEVDVGNDRKADVLCTAGSTRTHRAPIFTSCFPFTRKQLKPWGSKKGSSTCSKDIISSKRSFDSKHLLDKSTFTDRLDGANNECMSKETFGGGARGGAGNYMCTPSGIIESVISDHGPDLGASNQGMFSRYHCKHSDSCTEFAPRSCGVTVCPGTSGSVSPSLKLKISLGGKQSQQRGQLSVARGGRGGGCNDSEGSEGRFKSVDINADGNDKSRVTASVKPSSSVLEKVQFLGARTTAGERTFKESPQIGKAGGNCRTDVQIDSLKERKEEKPKSLKRLRRWFNI